MGCFWRKEKKKWFDKKFIKHKTADLTPNYTKEPEVETHFREY